LTRNDGFLQTAGHLHLSGMLVETGGTTSVVERVFDRVAPMDGGLDVRAARCRIPVLEHRRAIGAVEVVR
jgi:hypothetical protein